MSEITIPVIDIASPRPKTVEVRVSPLSDNLYRVIMGNEIWELTFLGLGELGDLIKEPKKLKEYKRRMMKCHGIKKGKKCGFYPYCNSSSKSKSWVCYQDKTARLQGCIVFWTLINRKKE